jgi:hypothetical protein
MWHAQANTGEHAKVAEDAVGEGDTLKASS